jgi:hypothetical protein
MFIAKQIRIHLMIWLIWPNWVNYCNIKTDNNIFILFFHGQEKKNYDKSTDKTQNINVFIYYCKENFSSICAFSRITFITLSAYFRIFRILFGFSGNQSNFYLSYWVNTEKGTEF